jgi:hypothetical protein
MFEREWEIHQMHEVPDQAGRGTQSVATAAKDKRCWTCEYAHFPPANDGRLDPYRRAICEHPVAVLVKEGRKQLPVLPSSIRLEDAWVNLMDPNDGRQCDGYEARRSNA